jgi:hypothetical protein
VGKAAHRDGTAIDRELVQERQPCSDLESRRAPVRRGRSGMRRDDVPEQHLLLEPELGQDAVDDRRRCLGGAVSGQLALGRERHAGDAGTAVARRLADEQDRSLASAFEVGGKALPAQA